MSAVLVLAHRQRVTVVRVQVHGHPVHVRVGATTIACDEATARAIRDALNTFIDGDDGRYAEPAGLPLPANVVGFDPHGPVEVPPAATMPHVRPPELNGWPSYRTDLERP